MLHLGHPTLLLALACGLALPLGCVEDDDGVPLDRPLFPTGMALAGDRLLVVSSDFDLAEGQGALLSADLAFVRGVVAADGPNDVARSAYTEAAIVPSFGDRPLVTSGGERVYVPTRHQNRLVVLDIATDGALSCPQSGAIEDELVDEGADRCGDGPSALQLADNDPFATLILAEERDLTGALGRVDGLITLQSSQEVVFFSDDPARDDRLQLSATLNLGDFIGGVRSAVLRPEVAGSDPVIIAGVELDRELDLIGARIALFQPDVDSELKSLDISIITGSLAIRDIVLVPGDDGEDDALVAVLLNPDAIARLEIDDVGGVPDIHMSVLESTCRLPTSLARARVPMPTGDVVDRVLLTCQDGNVVEALDPVTLRPTDAVRFTGRGPYDVVVNEALVADGGSVEVYVSFFLDGSIGTLRFNEDGRLEATGRIGDASERPEDGRE